jgi:hypothetical protein
MNQTALPLRDIHLPGSVSWWPLAPGWWILLSLLVLIPLAFLAWRRFKSRHRLQQEALAELQRIETAFNEHQDLQLLASETSVLLRRVCVSRFPRHDVAGLSGAAWIEFLNDKTNAFDTETAEILKEAPYRREFAFDGARLLNACHKWINELSSGPTPPPSRIKVGSGDVTRRVTHIDHHPLTPSWKEGE